MAVSAHDVTFSDFFFNCSPTLIDSHADTELLRATFRYVVELHTTSWKRVATISTRALAMLGYVDTNTLSLLIPIHSVLFLVAKIELVANLTALLRMI
jgi:hypothetical protein